jgi:acetyltransferase-like isoleucine patch superfamily enzyme
MHAYLLSTNRTISPFGRRVGEMKVHGFALQEFQETILKALGCAIERIEDIRDVRRFPCLLIHDDLYFTYHALAGFLKTVRRCGGVQNAQAALAVSELTERFTPVFQGVKIALADNAPGRAYDCFFLQALDLGISLGAQSVPVAIPYHVKRLRSAANRYFEPSGKFTLPVSRVYMTPVQHWASLMAANLLGMPDFFLHIARNKLLETATLPLRMIWRSGSVRPSRCLGKLYFAGPKCRIHPSAHVEGAVLGRRVRIGPLAVVRGSVIGDGTEIGPGAVVEGCTLGRQVVVNGNVVLRCCLADDEASLGTFFNQFSVIGHSAVMCPDCGIFDFQFKGSVRVNHQGRMVPSGSRLLGGCLGDRVFLGPGVKILCGQELPNDCILVQSPHQLVRGVEKGMPECVVRIDREGRDQMRRLRRAS